MSIERLNDSLETPFAQAHIATLQQETAYKEYLQTDKEVRLAFWGWYAMWCIENGLYNDQSSHQYDRICSTELALCDKKFAEYNKLHEIA